MAMRRTGGTEQPEAAGLRSADMVYHAVRRAILEGELAPGDRLLEERLAADLGVSRTPVREAIARLEAERFVERSPRAGLIVTVITQREIEDVYAVREVLEGLAARLCAQVAASSDRQRLELLEAEMELAAASGDSAAMEQANRTLHDALAMASRNDALIHTLQQIRFTFVRYGPTTMGEPGRAEVAVRQHRALLQAIFDRDENAAERLAREHIESARNVRLLMHTRRRTQHPTDGTGT